jgi:hypothetical protein
MEKMCMQGYILYTMTMDSNEQIEKLKIKLPPPSNKMETKVKADWL